MKRWLFISYPPTDEKAVVTVSWVISCPPTHEKVIKNLFMG